jgi:hypothetical protein
VVDDGPPKGWTVMDSVLCPGDRVTDFAARAQSVMGVCRAKGCSRKVELEPKNLCGLGAGLLGMTAIKKTWRCQRLDGCGLDFHDDVPAVSLRLSTFIGRPNVRLRIRCRERGCKFFRVWRVEQMIAGLKNRGQGGGSTEIEKLGPMMTSPCPVCKKASWTAEVLWIDTSTMGWKAKGERSFDRFSPAGSEAG